MTVDIEQMVIQHSVRDVIKILVNEPVQHDFVSQVTAVQIINRVSLAHLSIERAMKFLIEKAGGTLVKDHDLGKRLRELTEHDPKSAAFLRLAFDDAVAHFRYKPKAAVTKHVGSLDAYFSVTGSDHAFNKLRYWELKQPMDDEALGRVQLTLHLEILYAIDELLHMHGPFGTVANRVEQAIGDALFPSPELINSPEMSDESLQTYVDWLSGFSSRKEAISDAFRRGFDIGSLFGSRQTVIAYNSLLKHSDPAVSYFTHTLGVLPPQPRDAVAEVEWIGEEEYRRGAVSTPGGTPLGIIERGLDALWYITPARPGLVQVAARAESQTDARSYLATLLTQEVEVKVAATVRSMRLVGGDHRVIAANHDRLESSKEREADDGIWTHKVTFWETPTESEIGDFLKVRVPPRQPGGLVHLLQGEILQIDGAEVRLSGEDVLVAEGGELSEQFFDAAR
jgi:hypothetical protein